jgi:hypothetical protein
MYRFRDRNIKSEFVPAARYIGEARNFSIGAPVLNEYRQAIATPIECHAFHRDIY